MQRKNSGTVADWSVAFWRAGTHLLVCRTTRTPRPAERAVSRPSDQSPRRIQFRPLSRPASANLGGKHRRHRHRLPVTKWQLTAQPSQHHRRPWKQNWLQCGTSSLNSCACKLNLSSLAMASHHPRYHPTMVGLARSLVQYARSRQAVGPQHRSRMPPNHNDLDRRQLLRGSSRFLSRSRSRSRSLTAGSLGWRQLQESVLHCRRQVLCVQTLQKHRCSHQCDLRVRPLFRPPAPCHSLQTSRHCSVHKRSSAGLSHRSDRSAKLLHKNDRYASARLRRLGWPRKNWPQPLKTRQKHKRNSLARQVNWSPRSSGQSQRSHKPKRLKRDYVVNSSTFVSCSRSSTRCHHGKRDLSLRPHNSRAWRASSTCHAYAAAGALVTAHLVTCHTNRYI